MEIGEPLDWQLWTNHLVSDESQVLHRPGGSLDTRSYS